MQFSVKSIVVLGGGTAGWSAAAMFAERYKRHDLQITVIESPDIPTVGVGEATVPGILAVHKNLNLNERAFLKATQATFKLGIEFQNWNTQGGRFFHPFSQFGTGIGGEAFHQCWIRLKQAGHAYRLEDFSLGAVLARENRFALPDNTSENPLAWYGYAYHFDASFYARFLRQYAEARGVRVLMDTVTAVDKNPDNGFIQRLHLASGAAVEADFFIDCTGFRSLLLAQEMGVAWEDWSHWLPCDSAVVAQTESEGVLKPYTTSTALSAGWRWNIPLQNRMGNGYVYASQYLDDDRAREEFLASLSTPRLMDTRVIRFKAGMRRDFWVKNCAALGLASGFLEPLESTSISLMHTGVDKIIEQMPGLQVTERGVAEANRLNRMEYERIRDFIVLHYWASKRDDTDFWRSVRAVPPPDMLQAKVGAFLRDGSLLQYERESFREPSWLALYNGFGLTPATCSPAAQALPVEPLVDVFERLRSAIGRSVTQAPSQADFLATV